MSDANGILVHSQTYEPFGSKRNLICTPDNQDLVYSFTDQEWDSETGLYNYDARLYDPVIGQFIMADTIVPDWFNPQSLNRYAYCLNNPVRYVDPSGHDSLEAEVGYGPVSVSLSISCDGIYGSYSFGSGTGFAAVAGYSTETPQEGDSLEA